MGDFKVALWPRLPGVDAPVVRELSSGEMAEIRLAFDLFCSGQVSCAYRDLKATVRALGFPLKKAYVLNLLDRYNKGDATSIDCTAFRAILTDLYRGRDDAEASRRAFSLFDIEGKGKVSAANLRVIAAELGVTINDSKIQAMVDEFDQDRDGLISEAEFLSITSLQEA